MIKDAPGPAARGRAARTRSSRLGMTIVEAVVAVAILSLVTISLFSMLAHSITGWSSGTSSDTATARATLALQRLANDIRDAKFAQVISGSLVVTFPAALTDGGTGESVYDLSGSNPVLRYYRISGGSLVRTVGGTTTTLAHGITSATFGAAGGTVTVTLTAQDRVGSHTATRQLTGRIALRNFRS